MSCRTRSADKNNNATVPHKKHKVNDLNGVDLTEMSQQPSPGQSNKQSNKQLKTRNQPGVKDKCSKRVLAKELR